MKLAILNMYIDIAMIIAKSGLNCDETMFRLESLTSHADPQ